MRDSDILEGASEIAQCISEVWGRPVSKQSVWDYATRTMTAILPVKRAMGRLYIPRDRCVAWAKSYIDDSLM